MRVLSGRRSAAFVALISILLLATTGSAVAAKSAPAGLSRFMYAIGEVESGGNYYARNPSSGAYGKYQIMPSNWPSWARQYVGNSKAKQTPANQEKVATGKMIALHHWLGSWPRVAHWWLTGSSRTSGWSDYATGYVNKVMRLYKQGGGEDVLVSAPKGRTSNERSSAIAYTGTWRQAKHRGYGGGSVAYATSKGASATFVFSGSAVSWYGPLGPTRGNAKVYVDGKYVKTVDLKRSAFDARARLFRFAWSKPGEHALKIVVVGTSGRPMVAIDVYVVLP